MSTTNVKKTSLFGSVGKVSGATAVSRILGLVREQTMAYFFGASMATDVFVAAYRIPNLLRDLFAEGALSSAFVPVFKEKLVKGSDEEAFTLARTVATSILVVVGIIVLLGMVATPAIIYVSAHGFTAEQAKFDLTVDLTRLMFVYLLLVSLSALVMGILNSFGRFGIPALSPAMFNLGIIATVVVLYSRLDVPIYALAIGVLVGGVGQLVVQLPQLWKIGFRFRWRFDFLDDSFKKVVGLFLPMIVGMSAGRINILVNTLVASYLMEGSLSFLNYSYRLMHFPLGVFAVALGTVALPRASEMAARNDMVGLGDSFREALGLNMFLIVPSAVFLAILGRGLVDVIYQYGAFTATDAAFTAQALFHYSYGLIGFAAVRVTVPIFYGLKDSIRPMRVSIVTVIVNMALYWPLTRLLNFAGLAAATSIAGLLNFGLLLYFLKSKGVVVPYASISLKIVRVAVASGLAVFCAMLLPSFDIGLTESSARLVHFALKTASCGILYLIFCAVLRVEEVGIVVKRLTRRS